MMPLFPSSSSKKLLHVSVIMHIGNYVVVHVLKYVDMHGETHMCESTHGVVYCTHGEISL